MDVSHPGPGVSQPSIASLVYSHDQNALQYRATSAVQGERMEIFVELKDMMEASFALELLFVCPHRFCRGP
jgi:eukaryotic translation initiation factor 2C